MTQTKPYFLNNSEWWYFDRDEWCLKLTDKAPKEAQKSYTEYYKELEKTGRGHLYGRH